MPSVNRELLDRQIGNAVAVQRASRQLAGEIGGALQPAWARALGTLEGRLSGISGGPAVFRTDAYRAMMRDLRGGIDSAYAAVRRDVLVPNLRDLSRWTSDAVVSSLEATPLRREWKRVSGSLVREIVHTRPAGEGTLGQWWRGLQQAANRDIAAIVNRGLRDRVAPSRIVAGVRRRLDKLSRDATTVTKTLAAHVASESREETYRLNGGAIHQVLYVAVLDSRTTEICRDLNGNTYPIDEGPRPPQHPRCRSSTEPLIGSLRQLGLKGAYMTPEERTAMSGGVPKVPTYSEWLADDRRTAAQLDYALGPTRGREYRQGTYRPESYTDPRSNATMREMLQRATSVRP